MYDILLNQLEKRTKPIDLIVVGLGFMGFGFVSSIQSLKGIRVALIITRRVGESMEFLRKRGFKAAIEYNPSKIKRLADQGFICVSDDLSLIRRFENLIVFEVTGTVDYGAEVALMAIKAKKHLVTMNPELQVAVGSELQKLAEKENVVITDVYGDQPGSLARLISQARLRGFRVLMAGNMKRYLDLWATQEKMKPWAQDKGLAVRQTTSFTDGTKQSIEMNLVANYFGMKVLKRGMVGHTVENVQDVLTKFDWTSIPKEGVVDYVIGKNLFPGVFIVVEHPDPNQKKYLKYLGLGDGPQYVMFEPYHLCHLEAIETILKVLYFKEPTINNRLTPLTKTVAMAKRNLLRGEKLDGIGGDSVYGMIQGVESSEEFLPVGFAHNAIIKTSIGKDTPVKISDVIIPVNAATKLAGLAKTQKYFGFFGSQFLYKLISLF